MGILCVDDHPIILNRLRNKVLRILPNDRVGALAHARDVMQLRPSGYPSKPASIYQLKEELLNLQYPVGVHRVKRMAA